MRGKNAEKLCIDLEAPFIIRRTNGNISEKCVYLCPHSIDDPGQSHSKGQGFKGFLCLLCYLALVVMLACTGVVLVSGFKKLFEMLNCSFLECLLKFMAFMRKPTVSTVCENDITATENS